MFILFTFEQKDNQRSLPSLQKNSVLHSGFVTCFSIWITQQQSQFRPCVILVHRSSVRGNRALTLIERAKVMASILPQELEVQPVALDWCSLEVLQLQRTRFRFSLVPVKHLKSFHDFAGDRDRRPQLRVRAAWPLSLSL